MVAYRAVWSPPSLRAYCSVKNVHFRELNTRVGSPIGGTNIHGPSAITMMLTIPATILAVILLIMAAFGSREAQ